MALLSWRDGRPGTGGMVRGIQLRDLDAQLGEQLLHEICDVEEVHEADEHADRNGRSGGGFRAIERFHRLKQQPCTQARFRAMACRDVAARTKQEGNRQSQQRQLVQAVQHVARRRLASRLHPAGCHIPLSSARISIRRTCNAKDTKHRRTTRMVLTWMRSSPMKTEMAAMRILRVSTTNSHQ